ncbi:MAG: exodeoxyribonuclease VII large subunit [Clostridiales bacterium]|nr:exodeoxyribonuclease VII large subunit [Clostridiales bacterium]
MEIQALSVSQLNEYVSTLFSNDSVLCQLCVKGEISGFKRYPSGHAYFQLKDEKASVSCVMFKGSYAHLNFVPENGMKVLLFGRAGLYEVDGRFQVVASFMQEDGMGDLFKEYEKLQKKLAAEGLFDTEHKKPIPFLPKRIGVVSSPKGAVIQDIINVLSRRYPNFDLLLAPSSVQGKEAATELIRGLKLLDDRDDIDVIIIARGGGSMEDLWCFNDENLCRAIYNAKKPVISAVGHETDYTLCDFCADLRAPTPSAAAELVMPAKAEVLARLSKATEDLSASMNHFIKHKQHQLDVCMKHRALETPRFRLEMEQQRFDQMLLQMQHAMESIVEKEKSSMESATAQLLALNPMAVLLRGYSYVTDAKSQTVDSIKCVNIEDEVQISVSDGVISAKVTDIKHKEGDNNGEK